MKELSFERMEEVQGGIDGCDVSLGLVVSIWAVGFGIVNPLAGFAIGYLGGLAAGAICSRARKN